MSDQILRLIAVKEITGLSGPTVYRLAAKEQFPKPIKLGSRSSGWLKSEVDQWITDRVTASRGQSEVEDV